MAILGMVTHHGIPWRALGQAGLAILTVMSTQRVMGLNQPGLERALEIPEWGGL